MKKLSLFVNPLLSIVGRQTAKFVTIISLKVIFGYNYFRIKYVWYTSRTFVGTFLEMHGENHLYRNSDS